MNILQRSRSFVSYWLDEVNEHSLHSPFLYDFYKETIQKIPEPNYDIESLRNKYLKSNELISYNDPGASKKAVTRKISDISRESISTLKYSLLYKRIIEYYEPALVVELGTCLGINTLYLADHGQPVYTFEGVNELVKLSKLSFHACSKNNIKIIQGDIDETLIQFVRDQRNLPFVFFDANHTYEATMRYFTLCTKKADKNSIFIFDDIHWSAGMEKAWKEIKAHDAVQVSVDLFRCGIVFFNKALTRQHMALKF